jgi:peptidoglycan/xylan/chitin deacetylase (PgdA/CDA1 family)
LSYDTNNISNDWKGAITLTFDDGWRSIYENALPILQRAGIKSTCYVVSGYLDDEQFPAYMNTTQIFELNAQGHEIGCHTASHKNLPKETDSIIESEVNLSLKFLRGLGVSVQTFAYPFGEYDSRVVRTVKDAGFLGARSVERGFNDQTTDRFLLQCRAVKVSTTVSEVIAWIESARSQAKWLILMFHQIDEEGREFSARPQTLSRIADYLRENDVRTLTVREGLKELEKN